VSARTLSHSPRQRADIALVARGFFESRAQAQAAIAAGLVSADGAAVRKASEGIAADAQIIAERAHPYVSRGGVKLAAGLDAFGISPQGLICLDVGASTGGFTDALLMRGAAHVIAVDVGHGQLHGKLRVDARVTSLEGLDIRTFDATSHVPGGVPFPPALIVADVSFIGLAAVLPAITALSGEGTRLVALVKPQFELGRKSLGKGGIVKDEAARTGALESVKQEMAALGWRVDGQMESPISGGDGNLEYLVAASRAGAGP
jgi:23S rRNA (cytidine1920-2'-O)/16S rRNA (cytidine1409-2'-O)-methyltransferase